MNLTQQLDLRHRSECGVGISEENSNANNYQFSDVPSQNNKPQTLTIKMTFKFIDEILGSRTWRRWGYTAWWKRYGKDAIDLHVGYRALHRGIIQRERSRERVLRLHRDGRITVSLWLVYPSERNHLNRNMSLRWRFKMFGGYVIKYRVGKPWRSGLAFKNISKSHTTKSETRYYPVYLHFSADGKMLDNYHPIRASRLYKRVIRERNMRAAPRKRGWYWQRRQRNLFLDASKCKFNRQRNWYWQVGPDKCVSEDWRTPPARTFDCGCRTYRKKQKPFTKTVEDILAESNATVRACWMQMYGLDKFFRDAKSRVLMRDSGYELLHLNTGDADKGITPLEIRALKMTCPSTGTVHVNMVPLDIRTIDQGLDWMFNVRDFRKVVGQQT